MRIAGCGDVIKSERDTGEERNERGKYGNAAEPKGICQAHSTRRDFFGVERIEDTFFFMP